MLEDVGLDDKSNLLLERAGGDAAATLCRRQLDETFWRRLWQARVITSWNICPIPGHTCFAAVEECMFVWIIGQSPIPIRKMPFVSALVPQDLFKRMDVVAMP